MNKLLALLALTAVAATTHAATYYVPTPFPQQGGKPCLIKFGANVMVNLSSITVFRFYDKDSDVHSAWKLNTVLFVGNNSVQIIQGNALDSIEKRLEECNK